MPYEFRSKALIDLFLDGVVRDTMGENVAMMGYAKAALALGCERVVMFESYVDFIRHIDKASDQVYMMDLKSLPALKDNLLLDPVLRRRTWELRWFGRDQKSIRHKLNITDEYGFKPDHSLIPFNYTIDKAKENIPLTVLPTAITMNHIPLLETEQPKH